MKLMSDLESFRDKLFILTASVFNCIILYSTAQFKALLSNFKFCSLTKMPGRDLGAKLTPRSEINHQNMLAKEWSRNCHF